MSTAPTPIPSSVNGWSAEYLERQYELYRTNPGELSAELRSFFAGFDLAMAGELRMSPGAGGASAGGTDAAQVNGAALKLAPAPSPGPAPTPPPAPSAKPAESGTAGRIGRFSGYTAKVLPAREQPAGKSGSYFQAVVDDLIDAYRDQGHLAARLDPFGRERARPEALKPGYHGLDESDLASTVDGTGLGLSAESSLHSVIDRLESIYCSTIGVEFMHIQDADRRAWLLDRFERAGGRLNLARGQRAHILELLVKSEMFEQFLGKRYPGEKRFSLEGSESLIPLLDRLLETATELGVEEVVLGMAHRGRLNVLNNVLGKTYRQIFTEFEETWLDDYQDGGGDVKYHRGYSGTRRYPNGRMLHLAMASNPSHLESVAPVVQGRCRAKQRLRADFERVRVIPVVLHGDAAVAGQGIVAEVQNFSQLEGYTTGGTVHVVVNNQIGFTTTPEDGRSSRYCTDIGKAIDAPIFHVNGEDPEAVAAVGQFAMEYRQEFRRDVWIDLQCYRKYGHNEQDEASFTNPILAGLIKRKTSVLTTYSQRLLDEQAINQADMQAIRLRLDEALEQAQRDAREDPHDPTIDPGSARWSGHADGFSFESGETAVSLELLGEVCEAMGRVPEGFNLNRKLKPLLEGRSKLCETGDISWADAEHLAFGTLLLEGHPLRLSGQDSRRGTFSHRHAVLRDAETGESYIPLNNMRELGAQGTDSPPGSEGGNGKPRQAKLCVYDSPLSEAGVLGFDYGYSLADPQMMVMWEAQFGDFANGAQVIFDQYIASAEQKWERWSGLVVLLPHGYEGQGPEHSSGRIERYLKLCGGNNMQVIYPSTAAQCFHMFRRQMKRGFRKPLICFTPKSMLRTQTSRIEELARGRFWEIIDDPAFEQRGGDRSAVTRVVLCCGKLYHELAARRDEIGREDVAIVRIEQLYPFHGELFKEIVGRYPESAELIYAQEEPKNMGGFLFTADRIVSDLGLPLPRFIGRPRAASPAVGSKTMHKSEQEQILTEAIGAVSSGGENGKPAGKKPGKKKAAKSG